MEITRQEAIQILKDHGLTTETNTGYYRNSATASPYTNFDYEIGIKKTYNRKEIYQWLGY